MARQGHPSMINTGEAKGVQQRHRAKIKWKIMD
jgi:hypothetical protein